MSNDRLRPIRDIETTDKITVGELRAIIPKIMKDVADMGCTQLQLCQEAGLNKDTIYKRKNPTIGTIIKLIEARDRLKEKLKIA